MNKLLSKKQVQNEQALENERLIRRGAKIAKLIDEMQYKHKREKEKYEEEMESVKAKLNHDILELQARKTKLENEIEKLSNND